MNMNHITSTPMWKRAFKGLAVALASVVVLDWLLDGRLRAWLPFRRAEDQKATGGTPVPPR